MKTARNNWISISGDTPQAKLAAVAQALHLEEKPLEWTKPGIGPVWRSKGGEFVIAAYRSTAETGFELQRLTFPEGRYPTLTEAKDAAEKARRLVTVVVRAKEYFR